MDIKRKRLMVGKKLLLLCVLLVIVIAGTSCVKGLYPIGWSGGAISGDTLFVGSKDGSLVAVNIDDESRRWSEPLKAAGGGGAGFGCLPATGCDRGAAGVAIYGTPAVAGDLVYLGGYNGKIYAFNSASLEVRWVYPREENLEPIVGGPSVAHGKVYIGGSDGKVYALDSATGDRQWEFATGDKIWSTPAIEGDTLFVGSFDHKLYALDAADGSMRWEFATEGAIAASPLVHDGTVYIGSFDRHIYAIDATNGQQIWQFPVEDEAGSKPGNWFWAKPVIYNNTIYAGNVDGKVYILNAGTGNEVVDAIDLGSPVTSSPVLGGNSIVVATEEGVVYAIDTATNEKRRLVDLEEKVYAPLFASDGVVYVHTDEDGLYVVEVQSGAVQEFNIR